MEALSIAYYIEGATEPAKVVAADRSLFFCVRRRDGELSVTTLSCWYL